MDIHPAPGLHQQAIAVTLAPGVMISQQILDVSLVVGAISLWAPLRPGEFTEQLVVLAHD
jgi:hypothetical protein